MAQFFVVPQWQGSAAARAMLLADGAIAIAGDLPSKATTLVPVPTEAGDKFDTAVKGFGAIEHVREALAEALADAHAPTIVIGGDASVTVSALAAAPDRDELALVWCSASPALKHPGPPELGFEQMALTAILGDGEPKLALRPAFAPNRVLLVGARNISDAESSEASKLTSVNISGHDALANAASSTSATGVWVHINLDVLDPAEIEGLFEPEPFGVTSADLIHSIKALKHEVPIVGASITGFAPRSADAATNDLGVILRLIGALA